MNLNELFRVKTREVFDAIASIEEKISRLDKERMAAEERVRTFKEEVSKREYVAQDRKQTLEEIGGRIRSVEAEIKSLRERLDLLLAEQHRAQNGVDDAVREAADLRKERQQSETKIHSIEEERERLVGERDRQRERIEDARRSSLVEYNQLLWHRLQVMMKTQETRAKLLKAARDLTQARHDDPEVAGLFEARQQWRRILDEEPVPMVREAALREIEQIEKVLEERFPGALEAEGIDRDEGEIEELYWFLGEESAVVFLPISIGVYDSISTGEEGLFEQLAMRLVWGLARSPILKDGNGHVDCHGDLIVLETRDWPDGDEDDVVQVSLAEGISVHFMLTPLRTEFQEALR